MKDRNKCREDYKSRTSQAMKESRKLKKKKKKIAAALPSILIIAFRDWACFDSPCIDPCWTPVACELNLKKRKKKENLKLIFSSMSAIEGMSYVKVDRCIRQTRLTFKFYARKMWKKKTLIVCRGKETHKSSSLAARKRSVLNSSGIGNNN